MPKTNGHLQQNPRCMNPGVLGTFVGQFVNQLTSLGHTRLTVAGYGDAARHFAEWLLNSDIAVVDVDDGVIARFARHRCKCSGNRQHRRLSAKYVRRVRRFVCFLIERGVVRAAAPKVAVVNQRVAEFQDWLRDHRGISERTVDRHGRMVMRLLPGLGDDPGTYTAELVRRVILAEAQRSSRPYIKTMMTALRGYLRFLAAHGVCQPWLDRAVPAIPQWRLSALPRYLPAADVERLITSCDLTKPHGIRDKAILLLLARLGLRAGDIRGMRLGDVEWNEGALRVRGKGRREVRLPLPQDAGDALLDYLERARPRVDDDRMFLRSSAPYRAFAGPCAVSDVVRLALKRAGIASPPSRGTNLLRHSAATGMLRAGATLDAIGAVLRHRSTDTTAHYAKVDIAMLRQIAQTCAHFADCELRFRAMVLISFDREPIFRTIMSGRSDRHGYWFRRLGRRQEFDCGRSAFACFLR
jgi:integrase/recombinase XerD